MTHPLRGCCVPECPTYSLCHCMCGERTKFCRSSDWRRGRVRGEPYVFLHNHFTRLVPLAARCRPAAPWSRQGVAIGEVRPLARWLRRKYGGLVHAGEVSGISFATLNSILYNTKHQRVTPATAKKIVEAVLAHRRPHAPWDLYQEPVRLPLAAERRLASPERLHRQHLRRHTEPDDSCSWCLGTTTPIAYSDKGRPQRWERRIGA
jgi:hypothetical protein